MTTEKGLFKPPCEMRQNLPLQCKKCLPLPRLPIAPSLIYNAAMKKLLLATLALIPLYACGPIEPGQGMSADEPPGRGGMPAAETMRQPLTGSSYNERLLYYYNRPEMADHIRRWQKEQFRRQFGEEAPNAEPAFKGLQRSTSPFRQ